MFINDQLLDVLNKVKDHFPKDLSDAYIFLLILQVALLKFTGYKIINNISDTGKAFLIILITDIFLG